MPAESKGFSLFNNETRKLARHYLQALDSPTSLGVSLCLKYGDDRSACSHEINPNQYSDPEDFKTAYLAAKFLSKFEEGTDSDKESRRAQSLKKFWQCEEYLRSVSPILNSCLFGDTFPNYAADVFYIAREKCAQILGSVRSSGFDILSCNFGPGSSSSIRGRRAHNATKFLSLDVTSSCFSLVDYLCRDLSIELPVQKKANFIDYSTITIVPKNFKSDRVIAIEPDWNIFFQKGAGRCIRSRLKRFGIDLDHGAEKHGKLSRIASLSGHLATVDLSSASDSISTQLVRFLLPDDWFSFLNGLRTSTIKDESGITHPLLKFSSMGNGFTFELETLVFYCLAFACCSQKGLGTDELTVFGDDIIIPNDAYDLLQSVFRIAGFRLNREKTFSTSYFRESCGEHYFRGLNVKPFYLRRNITDDTERYLVANSIRRLSFRSFHYCFNSSPLYSAYCFVVRHLHRVFYIPDGFGDGGLIESFDKVCPTTFTTKANLRHRRCACEGFVIRSLQPVGCELRDSSRGLLISKLWSLFRKEGVPVTREHKAKVYTLAAKDGFSSTLLEDYLSLSDPFETGNRLRIRGKIRVKSAVMYINEWRDPELL